MNRKRFRNYLILLSMAAAVLAAGLYLHMRKKTGFKCSRNMY